MHPHEYELMYRVEGRHWWYCGMASISRALMDRWYQASGALRILDAGCGTGGAATSFLAAYGHVTGLDLSAHAMHFCHLRSPGR